MACIIYVTPLGEVVTDFDLARRHYVYAFDTTSTITVTNDTKGNNFKLLGNVYGVLKGHLKSIS